MASQVSIHHRDWRVIAREVATETDSRRIIELSEELDEAFAAATLVPRKTVDSSPADERRAWAYVL